MDSPGGLPAPKGEKTHQRHICTIMQNFTTLSATVAEISVTKNQTQKWDTGLMEATVRCYTFLSRVSTIEV